MIYLDEKIASHRKILRAGRLLGDDAGGPMAALGLFVAAIGYARLHLTDGIVPDEFLQEASRNSDAISSLRKAKLIQKLRGSRWLIHDYLKWNPSAEQVEEQRELSKARQRRFRGKAGCGKPVRNGVTSALGESEVTLLSRGIPDPRSPIPDPRSPVQGTSQGLLSPVAVEVPQEQRPAGRETHAGYKLTRERRAALTRTPAADGNYVVLERLAHSVLEELHTADPESPEVVEALKVKCAALQINYHTDPHIVRRALVSAAKQRVLALVPRPDRPMQSLANLIEPLRRAPDAASLNHQLKGFAAAAGQRARARR